MPIGIVSDSDFELELSKLSKTQNKKVPSSESVPSAQVIETPSRGLIQEVPNRGRKEGDNNVPDSLRNLLAEEHFLNGRNEALSLARDFGISDSSVSAYAKGATSTTTYNEPKPSILNHIRKSRDRAIKRASRSLNGALSAITQEKLDNTDAKDLAVIAKNMSGIIKDLLPEDQSSNQSSQFNSGHDTKIHSLQSF